jgi:hypothetical protein
LSERKQTFQRPLGIGDNKVNQFRWVESGTDIFLEREDEGRDFAIPPISGGGCSLKRVSAFEWVGCPRVKLLYAQEKLLLIAIETQDSPNIEILESLQVSGKSHYFVRAHQNKVDRYYDIFLNSGWEARLCKEEKKQI